MHSMELFGLVIGLPGCFKGRRGGPCVNIIVGRVFFQDYVFDILGMFTVLCM